MIIRALALEYIYNILIFVTILNLIETYTFIDGKHSYMRYTQWNATANGTLLLQFKTYSKFGLLLYSDNSESLNSIKNSFVLQIKNAKLSVTIQMGEEDYRSVKTVEIGEKLNNLEWHHVNITRNGRESIITLDRRREELLISDGKHGALSLSSGLFVGGVSKGKTESLVNRNIIHMPRFVGCIKNLQFSHSYSPTKFVNSIIEKVKVSEGCMNACENMKCSNKGKCINRFTEARCDCKGTGFEGTFCKEAADSIQFRGKQYITMDVAAWQKRTSSDIIKLRFKTTHANGVILATLGGNDHLMLELHATIIRLSIDLGGGYHISEINNMSFNDGVWHLVEIFRNGRETSIQVDHVFYVNSSTPGAFTKFDMRNPLHIGGHPNKDVMAKINSKSKTNFTGCLQQVYYNDMKVIYQLFQYRSDRIKKYGIIKKECDVVKPKVKRARENMGSSVSKSGSTFVDHSKRKTKDQEEIVKSTLDPLKKNKVIQKDSNSLSQSSIVWITVGLVIGSIVLTITVGVIVHNARNRYKAILLSSSIKSVESNNLHLRRFSSNDRMLRGSMDRVLRGSIDHMTLGSSDGMFRASTDRLIRGSTDRILRGSTDRLMRIDRTARSASIGQIPRLGLERTHRGSSDRRLVHSICINDRLPEDQNEESLELELPAMPHLNPNIYRLTMISSTEEISDVNEDPIRNNDRDMSEMHVL